MGDGSWKMGDDRTWTMVDDEAWGIIEHKSWRRLRMEDGGAYDIWEIMVHGGWRMGD
jgi:hypothetical protein